jgi:glycosyltransferase involved in cell wall biosynthesis
MSEKQPIIYVVDGSVAMTGAFISARMIAAMFKDTAEVRVILPNTSTIPIHELGDFSELSVIPMLHLSKRLGALLRYIPTLLDGAWLLSRRVKANKADCVILNDFYLMHGALLRLFGYRGRIVTFVRCEPKRFAGFLAYPMLMLMRLSSNDIVTTSRFIRGLLPQHWNVSVIPNFYTGATRAPKTWGKNDEKTILFIGNYIHGKGQDIALRAFVKAAAQDATLKLSFHGADMGLQKNRDYRASLEAMAQQLGIAQRVTFGEFVADTYPLLETAYAALNCSVSESFSRTVLEASGAGVPVIATASGGPQEILVEGVTGYLVPVNDVDAIAERIVILARDTETAATMGQSGAAHIQQYFSREKIIKQLSELFGV